MHRYLPMMIALLFWVWPPILIRYLEKGGFDPYTQNFYRYLAAALTLFAIGWFVNRQGVRKTFARPFAYVLPGLLACGFQTFWVVGIYYLKSATLGTLIVRANVLVAALLGFFLGDERRTVKDLRFMAALLCSLAGVAGIVLFKGEGLSASGGEEPVSYAAGVLFVLLGATLWVVYAFVVKLTQKGAGSIATFAASASWASVFMLITALVAQAFGGARLQHVVEAEGRHVLVLFGSGILFVGVAQSLYYKSVELVGVAVSQSMTLVAPVLTGLFAWLIFKEYLLPWQWLSAGMLLGSLGYLLFLTERKRRIMDAEAAG